MGRPAPAVVPKDAFSSRRTEVTVPKDRARRLGRLALTRVSRGAGWSDTKISPIRDTDDSLVDTVRAELEELPTERRVRVDVDPDLLGWIAGALDPRTSADDAGEAVDMLLGAIEARQVTREELAREASFLLRAMTLQSGDPPKIPRPIDVALRRKSRDPRAIAFAHALVRELRRPHAIDQKDAKGQPATSFALHHGAPRSELIARSGTELIFDRFDPLQVRDPVTRSIRRQGGKLAVRAALDGFSAARARSLLDGGDWDYVTLDLSIDLPDTPEGRRLLSKLPSALDALGKFGREADQKVLILIRTAQRAPTRESLAPFTPLFDSARLHARALVIEGPKHVPELDALSPGTGAITVALPSPGRS